MKDGRYRLMAYKTEFVSTTFLTMNITYEKIAPDPYVTLEVEKKGDTLSVGGNSFKFSDLFRKDGLDLGYFVRTRFIPTNDIVVFSTLDTGSNEGF